MNKCPRCGKFLMTEQGLYYHLNKKFRCDKWICKRCNLNCGAKYRLQIHEHECMQSNINPCHKHKHKHKHKHELKPLSSSPLPIDPIPKYRSSPNYRTYP
jgi:hypothetical protein